VRACAVAVGMPDTGHDSLLTAAWDGDGRAGKHPYSDRGVLSNFDPSYDRGKRGSSDHTTLIRWRYTATMCVRMLLRPACRRVDPRPHKVGLSVDRQRTYGCVGLGPRQDKAQYTCTYLVKSILIQS
jgi:hypothetical protein